MLSRVFRQAVGEWPLGSIEHGTGFQEHKRLAERFRIGGFARGGVQLAHQPAFKAAVAEAERLTMRADRHDCPRVALVVMKKGSVGSRLNEQLGLRLLLRSVDIVVVTVLTQVRLGLSTRHTPQRHECLNGIAASLAGVAEPLPFCGVDVDALAGGRAVHGLVPTAESRGRCAQGIAGIGEELREHIRHA